ncbi:Carbon-nitrogen hydrolase [Streptomyces sp. Ncost-T10-10d]|nr:Carbon-nitrogen hydrolase [Streptomyces sp. Ncost-T10-10d]
MNNDTAELSPIAPYMAIGLSTIVHGVGARDHIARNLDTIEETVHAAVSIVGINLSVRLIAVAEGALTGFADEISDLPHAHCARELFIDIPGPETDRLPALARLYDTYIVVQCKARRPEMIDDRFFNVMVVISPRGEITTERRRITCDARSTHVLRTTSTTGGWNCSMTTSRPSLRCCEPRTSATTAPCAAATANIPKPCTHWRSTARRSYTGPARRFR